MSMRWAEHVARMGRKRIVKKPESKKIQVLTDGNSKIKKGNVKWINVAQYMDKWWAFVNTTMNLRVP